MLTATVRGSFPLTRRTLQILVALALVGCALSPFVEMAVHSDGSIFQSGYDTETTFAVLLLLLELTYGFTRLFVFPLPRMLRRLGVVCCEQHTPPASSFVVALPEISPTLPLRI